MKGVQETSPLVYAPENFITFIKSYSIKDEISLTLLQCVQQKQIQIPIESCRKLIKYEIFSILYIFISHQNGVTRGSWTILPHSLCLTLKAFQVPFFISIPCSIFPLEQNWKKRKLSSIEHYPCVKMPGATLISEYTFKIICCFDDWQSLYKWQSMHKKNDGRSTGTRSLTDLQKELVKLATLQGNCSDWAKQEMVLGHQEEAIPWAQKRKPWELITFLVDCSRCCFVL